MILFPVRSRLLRESEDKTRVQEIYRRKELKNNRNRSTNGLEVEKYYQSGHQRSDGLESKTLCGVRARFICTTILS